MKLRSALIGSVAFATLYLVAPPLVSQAPIIPVAQAATSVSINIFYDDLAAHGDWVNYRDRYVFVPANIGDDWRPYTRGHWVYASDYGWTWVSDEPFGWATYHYGRWGYSDEIGWYWVPGTRWAPAWVSWRRSDDYVVWAPLPPSDDDDDVEITVSVGDIPDRYWVAVPASDFVDVDLTVVLIEDDDDRVRILQDAEFVGTVKVENDIVVNNVLEVNYIEEKSGKEVREVKVRKTDDPRTVSSDNEITAFEGKLERSDDEKPSKVTDVEEVRSKRASVQDQDKVGAEDQPQGQEESAQPDQDKQKEKSNEAATGEDQPDKKKMKSDQAETQGSETDEQAERSKDQKDIEDDASKSEAKKKQGTDRSEEPSQATEQSEETQPAKKKKKQSKDAATNQQTGEEQAEPNKKKRAKQSEDESTASQQPDDQNGEAVKKKRKDSAEQEQEPAADEQPTGSIDREDEPRAAKKQGGAGNDEGTGCDPAAGDCAGQ
jgi:hypothetical protein